MRAKVAVATVQGKAYFLIVNELKRRNIPFISLIPGEPVPIEIRAVITTEEERQAVNHEKVLVYDVRTDPEILGSEVVKILQGKEAYERVVVGVDPGDAFGLAVVADGDVIDTENCFSVKEVLSKVGNLLKTIDAAKTAVTVKVGNGVPVYRELLEALDDALPAEVTLEVVGEAGTNHVAHEAGHRRGWRHIVSAIRIAGRTGHVYSRGKTVVQDG
ncbi:MAG: hypothetical protein ACE14S_03830 [Candidatus Bathyarchaeia archaeon]